MDRALEIAVFLERHRWDDAWAEPFESDFSPRRYARLTRPNGETAVLMDADPDQNTTGFVTVDRLLQQAGLHAPKIFAANALSGLLLLEDLGKRNVGSLIDAEAVDKNVAFERATDLLILLHRSFSAKDAVDAGLPTYDTGLLLKQVSLYLDTYFILMTKRDPSSREREYFAEAWHSVLHPLEMVPQSLMLRDFMPDNLMETDDGLGVLDFQDAGLGSVAYDLASLCEVVRRDGGFDLLPAVVARYCAKSPLCLSSDDLTRACTILSAQRHVRILGIIAQIAFKQGRREKLHFLPRIRRHLVGVLAEPYLAPVRKCMNDFESQFRDQ